MRVKEETIYFHMTNRTLACFTVYHLTTAELAEFMTTRLSVDRVLHQFSAAKTEKGLSDAHEESLNVGDLSLVFQL